MSDKFTYIYRRKYSGNISDVFYAKGYVFYSHDDYLAKRIVYDESYNMPHNSTAVELVAADDPGYQQSIDHKQELVTIFRRNRDGSPTNPDSCWKSGYQFMKVGTSKAGVYTEYGSDRHEHSISSVNEVISLYAYVIDREPLRSGETEEKQTEYEELREAAMAAQCAIANMLVMGGTDINSWFDEIVKAQQRLADKTNMSRKESEQIREKYKIKYPL